ncbi:hypothetical protein ACROYT_G040249 [Oculina patagonica]
MQSCYILEQYTSAKSKTKVPTRLVSFLETPQKSPDLEEVLGEARHMYIQGITHSSINSMLVARKGYSEWHVPGSIWREPAASPHH